jgi:hypothetical protein
VLRENYFQNLQSENKPPAKQGRKGMETGGSDIRRINLPVFGGKPRLHHHHHHHHYHQ